MLRWAERGFQRMVSSFCFLRLFSVFQSVLQCLFCVCSVCLSFLKVCFGVFCSSVVRLGSSEKGRVMLFVLCFFFLSDSLKFQRLGAVHVDFYGLLSVVGLVFCDGSWQWPLMTYLWCRPFPSPKGRPTKETTWEPPKSLMCLMGLGWDTRSFSLSVRLLGCTFSKQSMPWWRALWLPCLGGAAWIVRPKILDAWSVAATRSYHWPASFGWCKCFGPRSDISPVRCLEKNKTPWQQQQVQRRLVVQVFRCSEACEEVVHCWSAYTETRHQTVLPRLELHQEAVTIFVSIWLEKCNNWSLWGKPTSY